MRIVVLPLFLLAACGVTSHTFYIFDAPPAGVTAVRLFIAAVEAHIADQDDAHAADDASIDDDSKWRRLEIDRVIDVAAAREEETAAQLGEMGIPDEGRVTQIRLLLDLSKPQRATFQGNDCDLDT